jgi:hypothetical protein
VPRRVGEPVGDEHDRNQLVHGEVDPRDVRVEALLQPGEQKGEHDAGDRDVEVTALRTASKRMVRRAVGTTAATASIAIASRFVWIVKKLKKFPALNPGSPILRLANW